MKATVTSSIVILILISTLVRVAQAQPDLWVQAEAWAGTNHKVAQAFNHAETRSVDLLESGGCRACLFAFSNLDAWRDGAGNVWGPSPQLGVPKAELFCGVQMVYMGLPQHPAIYTRAEGRYHADGNLGGIGINIPGGATAWGPTGYSATWTFTLGINVADMDGTRVIYDVAFQGWATPTGAGYNIINTVGNWNAFWTVSQYGGMVFSTRAPLMILFTPVVGFAVVTLYVELVGSATDASIDKQMVDVTDETTTSTREVYFWNQSAPVYVGGKGPREDDLHLSFYSASENAYAALVAGEIDFIGGSGYSPSLFPTGNLDAGGFLTALEADNAFLNPNILTANVRAFNMYQFDLNNNYTIPDYPGIRSPMNYTEMRQAIALLIDKDYYVDTLLGGLAERIDQPVPARLANWGNVSMAYPFYPYEYDPAYARAVLDTTFPEGTTPNPDYDPGEPLSSQYLRVYPAGQPNEGTDLDPLKFCIRVESSAQRWAALGVVTWLRKLGVPINVIEGSSAALRPVVMNDLNYHFYTGALTTWKYPTHLYPLYHSAFAYSGGPNYVTGRGTHPQLDQYLAQFYASSTFGEAVTACQRALSEFTRECVAIPLWSDNSYCAWSRDLLGTVNMDGYGIVNPYTFMNAHKVDGSPIRGGLAGCPLAANSVYSGWTYDMTILDRMTLYTCLDTPPYNLAQDQPGFITNWETTTWDDEGEAKTLVRMNLRNDAYFCWPQTGDQGELVNASHLFWNVWLDTQVGDGWHWPALKDVHHIDLTSPYSCEIYFDTLSYWNAYAATSPLRPIDTWMAQGAAFINQTVEAFLDPTTPGALELAYDPVWIDYVTLDGTPLTMFVDYNIVRGDLVILTAQSSGLMEAKYWYVSSPTALQGSTPGSLPWQTIFEGAGMYYCTGLTPGAGGSATYKRNPFYYMVTPPLGEINFVRKANGNHKVDIYDLALACGAFGSQGTGVPSSHWFPGADLAPESGVIDIIDLITIGQNWDVEFDPYES